MCGGTLCIHQLFQSCNNLIRENHTRVSLVISHSQPCPTSSAVQCQLERTPLLTQWVLINHHVFETILRVLIRFNVKPHPRKLCILRSYRSHIVHLTTNPYLIKSEYVTPGYQSWALKEVLDLCLG